jgi:putative heme-binding domain-containing protein
MRRALLAVALTAAPALAQSHIAPTDAKSPADERASFRLPPGFEAQLVASEPVIGKPIQIAFDHRGRLWVTTSRHYPFPAAPGVPPADKLHVLSDFAPDGTARRVETFAADLNIPIGVLPLPDGRSCLVSEVGRVLKLSDTDGDGKADTREVILSGFGSKDTHGMTNSFVLKPDGWVYACHGFANDSTVTAKDGSTVTMNSGHTYRFRPDGSRVEPWTAGQVNPFGMTLDPGGNLYTADCHSKPITQLIRGAVYQSFSKPHDGLGFAPHVTRHDHGSTGLCGLVWYEADQFPKGHQGCMFIGNVVTNRINADRIVWQGSTPVAEELPDLLVSGDPWFRPTDLKLGPDGAVYVADFYNRTVAHYEVDLKHPARDKDRGRIWRVVHTGKPLLPVADLTAAGADLPAALKAPNLVVRQAAAVRLGRPPAKGECQFRDQRAELERLTGEPTAAAVDGLVKLIRDCPAEDTHLRHAARVALRNCLGEAVWDAGAASARPVRVALTAPDSADAPVLADALLGLATEAAGVLLADHLQRGRPDPVRRAEFATHVGRHAAGFEHAVIRWAAALPPADAAATLGGLCRGVQGRKAALVPPAFATLARAADRALADAPAAGLDLLLDAARVKPAGAEFPPAVRAALVARLAADQPEPVRLRACDAVLAVAPAEHAAVGRLVADRSTPPAVRERAALGLAGRPDADCAAAAADYLKDAPTRPATQVAAALAGHKPGAETLLRAVHDGKASARLLQDRQVRERLAATKVPADEVAKLTKDLPPLEARLDAVIRDRAKTFRTAKADPAKGKALFTQHCANCHQLGGEGAKIGPQLDGIGNRGADRLCEDILDPSRNVDEAFRTRVVTLLDGRTVSGAFVKVDGAVWVLADQQGKEVRLPLADVEGWKLSPLSPMPANFDALPADDFHHLLAYLLASRAK